MRVRLWLAVAASLVPVAWPGAEPSTGPQALIPRVMPVLGLGSVLEPRIPASERADLRLAARSRPPAARSGPRRIRASRSPVAPKSPRSAAVRAGQRLAAERGWTGSEWAALYALWMRESGWNPAAVNRSSGACGIPQFHPCNGRHRKRAEFQIRDGLAYIARRYDAPSRAWQHFRARGWY